MLAAVIGDAGVTGQSQQFIGGRDALSVFNGIRLIERGDNASVPEIIGRRRTVRHRRSAGAVVPDGNGVARNGQRVAGEGVVHTLQSLQHPLRQRAASRAAQVGPDDRGVLGGDLHGPAAV